MRPLYAIQLCLSLLCFLHHNINLSELTVGHRLSQQWPGCHPCKLISHAFEVDEATIIRRLSCLGLLTNLHTRIIRLSELLLQSHLGLYQAIKLIYQIVVDKCSKIWSVTSSGITS